MISSEYSEIQKQVCDAGIRLVSEGLVARTWGNISLRINDTLMAVTPSGIRYEELRPEHIVIVNITDGSYEGNIKPSGERKLHIAVYRARKDINAVMHTHQLNASICAAARIDVPVLSEKNRDILMTGRVLCAPYGLPGTGKLVKGTLGALGSASCALMANHGALCAGSDLDSAFNAATALENACSEWISSSFRDISGIENPDQDAIMNHYQKSGGKKR